MRSKFGWKIRNTDTKLPHFMYGIVDDNGLMEVEESSSDYKESYMLLFHTEEEAQAHIDEMNKDFCVHRSGEKVFWYKNRNNKPCKVNTRLTRFKSKYLTLQQSLNNYFKNQQ